MRSKYNLEDIKFLNCEFEVVKDALKNKNSILTLGLQKSQRVDEIKYLAQNNKIVALYHSQREANEVYKHLQKLDLRVCIIKTQEIRFYSVEAKNREIEADIIKNLYDLANDNYDVCILTAESLMKKYTPKEIINNRISFSVGELVNKDNLIKKLINYGYTREHKVEGVGVFASRGSIIDIFTPNYENPIRIELFDDEIDSIREFDIYTQKSLDNKKDAIIIPSKVFIYPEEEILQRGIALAEEDVNKNTSEDIRYDILRLREREYFEGVEKYIEYFYENSTLFEYFKDTLFVLNDPNRILDIIEGRLEEFKDNFVNALEKGFAISRQGNILLSYDEMVEKISSYKKIYNNEFESAITPFTIDYSIQFETRETNEFYGKLMEFYKEIKTLKELGYIILISLQDENTIKGIKNLFKENNLYFSDEKDFDLKSIIFTKKYFAGGSIYLKNKIAIFTKNEIYTINKNVDKKFKHKYKTKKIETFIELKVGDYIVHENYGIGRFVSTVQREFDNIRKDYIRIQYDNSDFLYLPLEQMDKIQRYIGNQKEDSIKLSKLGGNEWKNTKKKAKKIVDLIAQDLVDLYAKRENQKGYSFSHDTAWQKEFESDFPYVETNDQLNAIKEVKDDMQSTKIMDRLICGDVGYGKTEVALRAIFKASMDSKQSAFLVPTTVLAQQHYNTLVDRFKNFPIKVEVLSRFKTKREQEKVLEKIRTGEVDVIVGTHRILSQDVLFKDIGLIVIDEEQRFGVKDKEKLKKIRNNCDVISLSATPIPRTLHMSLSGIRDITTLEEPPRERIPIATYVMESRDAIIVDAIMREINRNGQVYFVYNRVQEMEKMYSKLQKLLPDITIEMAHGKMSAKILEKRLNDFAENKFDVLLCSTIIETGMDIGNANTIIVYDADKMGLSQLYQLRGRVGRTSRQGYAYFMYEKEKILTEVSEKRLKTIKEFTEFGSGFKVAMRDLEIRGAGTLLGETQHGHIADIGYELYVKMLDDAIKKIRGEEIDEEIETEIDIKLSAYIPQEYIEDEIAKIEIYKKITSIRNLQDRYELEEEIEDRFSNIPESVYALIYISYIKSLAKNLKIGKISKKGEFVNFYTTDKKIIVKKRFTFNKEIKLLQEIIKFLEDMNERK